MTNRELPLFVSAVFWYLQKRSFDGLEPLSMDDVLAGVDAVIEDAGIQVDTGERFEVAKSVLAKFQQ